ncbi:MAG: YggS family pyridoxal phosphate-dependent enzyme [Xanthomonadaceae bacterium]|nr:YggS family pyridoxal phosphate-dependent enzyme [Xanthomonadaceae bacterium]
MSASQVSAIATPPSSADALDAILCGIAEASVAAGRAIPTRLLAVSKTRDAEEIARLAATWAARGDGAALAFGENYVQEALAKRPALADLGLEWHLIGHLQSNKAKEAATAFDWVQTVDRPKLIAALAAHRPPERTPLNVLIQVNIDDEASKHGCAPDAVNALAAAIAAEPRLRLRGLMAIPAPDPDMARRREAFRRMRELYDALAARHPSVDTLSMGMSEDYALAIAEGATLVRVGTALFGPRAAIATSPTPQEPAAS